MRLFIAVNFSDDVKSRIIEIQERLRARVLNGNFSRPENLHLTLAFLGETPNDKTPVLSRIMKEITVPPFVVFFNHLGSFAQVRGELWWIGTDGKSAGFASLGEIHARLLRRLREEALPVDGRPFKAHITLAREVRRGQPVNPECPTVEVNVDHISLMKSEHIRGVLTYTELARREL